MPSVNNPPAEPTESSPLLSQPHEHGVPTEQTTTKKQWNTPDRLVLLFAFIVVLTALGDQLKESPQTRTAEAIICYRYYEKVDPSKILLGRDEVGPGAIGGVEELWCKIDEVQAELAALRGWQQFFDLAPSLLLSMPFGWAADRYGRRPIFLAGVFGLALSYAWVQFVTAFWQSFDIRVTWFSTLFAAFGGGPTVLSTIAFVILSDISTEAERATIFLRLSAFNMLAFMCVPPLVALLMEINPWIPNLGGTLVQILTAVLVAFCPETRDYQHRSPDSGPKAPQDTPPPRASTQNADVHDDLAQQSPSTESTSRLMATIKQSTAFLTNDWRVPLLILPFLEHYLRSTLGQYIIQFVSKRYGMKLSKAIILTTIRWGIIVALFFFIMPFASTVAIRYFHLSPQRKDLWLARLSMIILAVGWILVGASPNVPALAISLSITSLGWGVSLMIRSFLASLVPKRNIARVYSVISVVDTIGAMVGSPLMAGLFNRGLALGDYWIGLPFYFLGMISACFSILLFIVRLRKGEDDYAPVPEDNPSENEQDP